MNDEPHPLVRSHQLLRQLGGIHFEIRALSEREANMHAELSQILSEAWNERQKLTECYFSLLRALASLCEDSSVLVESRSQKEIAQCLLKLLHEHGLKFIDSKEGCLFDPVHHHCLTSIADASIPDGQVVSVVAREMVLHNSNSPEIILSPAKVVVNRLGDPQDGQEHTE